MRVLVLHSQIAADAPPDERDTLVAAEAVASALMEAGHTAAQAPFVPEPQALAAHVAGFDLVFNLVESVYGDDALAACAPAMLEKLGVPFTGSGAAAIAITADKPATKRILRAVRLPTPDWSELPRWEGLTDRVRYIVKAATADASVGLDDDAVVVGTKTVRARAHASSARHGGRWFAERYVEGREFNVAILADKDGPHVLPPAEMCFTGWDADKPKIVGYAAKWDDADPDGAKMLRHFGAEAEEPELARRLRELSLRCWDVFDLRGYARVDFRVDEAGQPSILEINSNPCLEPAAGFAAAAVQAGYNYAGLIDHIATHAHG